MPVQSCSGTGSFRSFRSGSTTCRLEYAVAQLNALHGKIGLLDELAAAYRIHPGGIWSHGIAPGDWTAKTPQQLRYRAERVKATVHLSETFSRNLGPEYQRTLRRQIGVFATQWTELNCELRDYSALRESAWKVIWADPSIYHLLRPTLLIALFQAGPLA